MRRAARIDGGPGGLHTQVGAALRKCGCEAEDTSRVGGGYPDWLVWTPFLQRLVLLECKADGGTLTPAQRRFHARFPAHIIRSLEDALAAAGVTTRGRRFSP